ncbi:Putative glycine dehydrogenase (decarboxylating), mitochondrial [Cytospora mali]|uniref:glycine dehydrogenase (aminomethyl-transferring) n=1 Tax=Cytospora mali TaxID=578113 RepID=A0A194UWJ5_CYTMA|nr:Putative glycine dehydrogenase (decarboxylating), mitochondrial [Valsa mali var. pyri (nom. inval.)]
MAANGFAVSRQLGRLNRAAGARAAASLSLRVTANAQHPWVCRSCSRSPITTTKTFIRKQSSSSYAMLDTFPRRHIGPDDASTAEMLKALDPPVKSLDDFVAQVIPPDVLSSRLLFPNARSETNQPTEAAVTEALPESEVMSLVEALQRDEIKVGKSFIGAGYYGTVVPEVIKRNVLESPAWYTSYTPYQPEISQGRLESLLNFQTLVSDLTALPISNASLLDEGTAAAEALTLSLNTLSSSRARRPGKTYIVSDGMHPQTLAVMSSRAEGFGIKIEKADVLSPEFASRLEELGDDLVGVMVQYPDTTGQIKDFRQLSDAVHKKGALLAVATDLLALTVLTPPGEWGADLAFGTAQRLGVPMGFGGPHAAFFAVTEKHKRKMPGRLIGVSKDRLGGRALRLALQTREQHIRREKATSNVCTAQALLANMTALYAIYHGPKGLKDIAERIMRGTQVVRDVASKSGWEVVTKGPIFDTVVIRKSGEESAAAASDLVARAEERGIHFRRLDGEQVGISIDESTTLNDLSTVVSCLLNKEEATAKRGVEALLSTYADILELPEPFQRNSDYLTHPIFNTHHSETEMLRYIHHLQSKDLSLVHSMIPLGSCTMKLNGSTEMALITKPGFANVHPFAPRDTVKGYLKMISSLEDQLKSITAMDGVSLQPNSGAQGEFAGLRAIRKYHASNGDKKRDICLIPCDTKTGNLDLADLEAKCELHKEQLGAMMITYPSTFGVFEPAIKRVCEIVHGHGGQVYMDGANMNAQIGLCSPGEIGADVCHLNLHKTFCIPHGGGGPGVGPICVKEHLVPHLAPTDVHVDLETKGLISSAPYGSASILPISWAYNMLMGASGLKKATQITLLNANYLLSKLKPHYQILYTNEHGRCAHEFILDARPFSASAGVEAIDIAKRLQDYGFHAPTMSWPVANTLMIEPTESESQEELDRFVDALISIREEIREVEEGKVPRAGNVLKMAPHPVHDIVAGEWDRAYTREKAVYPLPWLRDKKFWPSVGRVDDTYGDLNLFCTCPPVEDTTGGSV